MFLDEEFVRVLGGDGEADISGEFLSVECGFELVGLSAFERGGLSCEGGFSMGRVVDDAGEGVDGARVVGRQGVVEFFLMVVEVLDVGNADEFGAIGGDGKDLRAVGVVGLTFDDAGVDHLAFDRLVGVAGLLFFHSHAVAQLAIDFERVARHGGAFRQRHDELAFLDAVGFIAEAQGESGLGDVSGDVDPGLDGIDTQRDATIAVLHPHGGSGGVGDEGS